jgi:hypothetical protein
MDRVHYGPVLVLASLNTLIGAENSKHEPDTWLIF